MCTENTLLKRPLYICYEDVKLQFRCLLYNFKMQRYIFFSISCFWKPNPPEHVSIILNFKIDNMAIKTM